MRFEMAVFQILGDGNCLFRAVSEFIYRTQVYHRDIRLQVVGEICNRWNDYQKFIVGDSSYEESIKNKDDYRNLMSRDGTYGGHQELECLSRIFNNYSFRVYKNNWKNELHTYGKGKFVCSLLHSGDSDRGHYDLIVFDVEYFDEQQLEENESEVSGKSKISRPAKEKTRIKTEVKTQHDNKKEEEKRIQRSESNRKYYQKTNTKKQNSQKFVENNDETNCIIKTIGSVERKIEEQIEIIKREERKRKHRYRSQKHYEKTKKNKLASSVAAEKNTIVQQSNEGSETSKGKEPTQTEAERLRAAYVPLNGEQIEKIQERKRKQRDRNRKHYEKTKKNKLASTVAAEKNTIVEESNEGGGTSRGKEPTQAEAEILCAAYAEEQIEKIKREETKRKQRQRSRKHYEKTKKNKLASIVAAEKNTIVEESNEGGGTSRGKEPTQTEAKILCAAYAELNEEQIEKIRREETKRKQRQRSRKHYEKTKKNKLGSIVAAEKNTIVEASYEAGGTSRGKEPTQTEAEILCAAYAELNKEQIEKIKREETKRKQRQRSRKHYEKTKKNKLASTVAAEKNTIVKESDEGSESSKGKEPTQMEAERLCAADAEFYKRFYNNPFGFVCSICDRLWNKNDLRNVPKKSMILLSQEFPTENIPTFQTCRTCCKSLSHCKVPRLSRSNGFKYPKYPYHLPPIDIITERLVSPRIPFMQIRRLRFVNGSKGIIGQVINVPVDVNKMVHDLPRELDDDYAFNVNIKRHLIHKSSYLSGVVKKSHVKEWLKYLLVKPLYQLYNITVKETFFLPNKAPALEMFEGRDEENPMIETVHVDEDNVQGLLIAKQQTLMWSEEKYLDLAPGMKQRPIGFLYDKHAEELSFPSIYLGEPREFKIDKVTPYMMASSEIRRADRRGVKPEHVLYMAMKIMRMRLTDKLYVTFKKTGDTGTITRSDIEDKKFIEKCVDKNLSFLKSIPNSVHYWMQRKKDVFAMIRQLGKPSIFLTLSASEYNWPHLIRLLYRLSHGEACTAEDPILELSSDKRTTLVNDDPVTCCVYFNKLIDAILHILQSPKYSPFQEYRVLDYFKRIEFQQRGSPHAHLLLWLNKDPNEEVSEEMPATIKLIESLCSVDPKLLENEKNQTHKHTFTCFKHAKDEQNKNCRFGAPFWPMEHTKILIPMPKEDGRRDTLRKKYKNMHASLEFEEFENLSTFLEYHSVKSYEHYLNILRAGITRPRIFLKRTVQQRWINNFNPWIANVLKSNMDLQAILESYSCATYVLEYVNKTNRGISNLHKELIKLRDEYPDEDYSELLKKLGTKMLNSVEMSSQEAAWYLLHLHMSESSRQIEFIPTTWPHDRTRVRKSRKRMDEEKLAGNSKNIWEESIMEKYEKRPDQLNSISLAQFTAWYYKDTKGQYQRREISKVIRYCNYDVANVCEYKREMVLLHVPYRNEEVEFLDQSKFTRLYDEKEKEILEARKMFESNIDIDKIMEICREMFTEEEGNTTHEEKNEAFENSKALTDDFIQSIRKEDDFKFRMKAKEKMSHIVRKRENVMSAEEYCSSMRITNVEQRDLILEAIHRIFDRSAGPLQVFLTGPAGSGKTMTIKLLLETYNRFTQQHDSIFNSYIACASTGVAAAAINGTTVHSAFDIGKRKNNTDSFSGEKLNNFRIAMENVRAVVLDECSMIGSALLQELHFRLQRTQNNYEGPFGGIDIFLCGDLNQLPAVHQTPIYKRTRENFCSEIVWQSLKYYPLTQVMRQTNVVWSNILTKIGNGKKLTDEEKSIVESRFVSQEYAEQNIPKAMRIFYRNKDVQDYNDRSIQGGEVIELIAQDAYAGYKNALQLASARNKVHKMKLDETGKLPYMLKLLVGIPYMIRVNIDVLDGLVNGAIGTLRYIEKDTDGQAKRLWLSFPSPQTGKFIRTKCAAHVNTIDEISHEWTPVSQRIATINLNSKIISCKRKTFPVTEACASTAHASQGGTHERIVYDYDESHEQQLVYVALSRTTSIEGLYLTNKNNDHRFYHARGYLNRELQNEFQRLECHKLETIGHTARCFIQEANSNETSLSMCTLNVQSLKAHHKDVTSDFVIPTVKILVLTETWVANDENVDLPQYRLVSKFKRDNIRAGGVCIYEKNSCSNNLRSVKYELSKYDQQTMRVAKMQQSRTDVGDICAIKTVLHNRQTLIIAVYVSTNTTIQQLREFFTEKLNALITKQLNSNNGKIEECSSAELPIILAGDLNVNLNSKEGERVISFMKDNFDLELNNDAKKGTTRSNTCIDAVFTRNVENVKTMNYISYFSYHRPLITST